MKVSELVTKTGLKTFNEGADKEIMGVYISDMVSDIIGIKEGHLLITLQTHKNLIAAANLVDVAAIVFSRNKIPADDVVALANKAGIKLLGYDGDTWGLAKKLCELKIGSAARSDRLSGDLTRGRRLTAGEGIAETRQEFKGEREDLIPVLQRLQERDGYLRPDAIRSISRWLKVSENEIFGVATFYAQFRFHPPGRHHIKVCLGTACHVRGGEEILAMTQARLNIKTGETTADGEYDLERVACLGCCAQAPVVAFDDKFHSQMSVLKVQKLLDEDRGD